MAVQAHLCPSLAPHRLSEAALCSLSLVLRREVVEPALVPQPQVPFDALPIRTLAPVLATELGHTLHSCPAFPSSPWSDISNQI